MIVLPPNVAVITTVDPGKMTGISGVYADGSFFWLETTFDDTCRHLIELANKWREEMVLVCESFIIGPQTVKNTQAPWSLELIGVCRMVSRLYCGRELKLQSPAEAKRFSSDLRLQHLEWYKPGKGHANDAARHLLLALVTRGWIEYDTVRQLAAVVE
jgi:hypothetical protein